MEKLALLLFLLDTIKILTANAVISHWPMAVEISVQFVHYTIEQTVTLCALRIQPDIKLIG